MACNDNMSIGFSPLYSGGQIQWLFHLFHSYSFHMSSLHHFLPDLKEKEPLFGYFVSRNGSGKEGIEVGAHGARLNPLINIK